MRKHIHNYEVLRLNIKIQGVKKEKEDRCTSL